MTFYDLIRASLLEDAAKHPYPNKGDGSGQPFLEQHGETEENAAKP